ncbi:MAG: VanZ family protein [Gemmataceae bacterium]|nr:VanZ family protein [Gemmataceae bacterium]
MFAVFLGLWTWKLLEPYPVPESLAGRLGVDWKFYLSKTLHCGAYAFLTVLAMTLPLRRYWRWYFVGLLLLHGVGTEIGQLYVPNRYGSVRDVVIDWVGVGLGLLTCWVAARRFAATRAGG